MIWRNYRWENSEDNIDNDVDSAFIHFCRNVAHYIVVVFFWGGGERQFIRSKLAKKI
jgi:hypothetical protein